MKAITTLAVAALGLVSASQTNDVPLITEGHVNKIRNTVDFEVYNFEEHPFSNYTLNEIKQRLGSLDGVNSEAIPYGESNADLPTEFDSRTQWPDCIGAVRDQGSCGSCWAFAVATSFSDRACVAGQTSQHVPMSPQELVSCDDSSYGCNGGFTNYAWDYVESHGLVTETCYPYTSGRTQQSGKCMTVNNRCKKDAGLNREDFVLYKVKDNKQHLTVAEAKEAIFNRGPIVASFKVYEDFMSYKSGVYTHKSGSLLGGHAIRVVGWGVEDGVEYWRCANSWTANWGENGYFRIRVGDVGINGNMRSGLVVAETMNIDSFLFK